MPFNIAKKAIITALSQRRQFLSKHCNWVRYMKGLIMKENRGFKNVKPQWLIFLRDSNPNSSGPAKPKLTPLFNQLKGKTPNYKAY